jgi:hypothetical protein
MPIRNFRTAILLVVLAAGAVPGVSEAVADETTTTIRKAETLYRQGKLGKAFTRLEEAATLVGRKLAAEYAKTFPPALPGWRAEGVQSSTKGRVRIGRGLSIRQNFFEKGGKGVLTAHLIVDDQGIIAAIKALKPAPQHAKRVKRSMVPVKGAGTGFVKFDGARGVGDVYIFVADRFYITVSGHDLANERVLTGFLASWNFAGLKRAAGID